MGKLTNLNPSAPLADADIPATIARDTETAAAVAAHVSATDPHTQYLTSSEGDLRYRRTAVALTDADIPATIARDTETAAAISAHEAKINPHTFYSYGDVATATAGTGAINFMAGGTTANERAQNGAFIAFHRPGIAANYFGLSTTNNLCIGGWSNPNASWLIWHQGYGTPVWQAPSDIRLKRKIRPIPSALSLILEMKPVSFEYNSLLSSKWGASKYTREKIHYGFIADTFPLSDLVSEQPETGYLGLDYMERIPFLVRSIQELSSEIENLKKTIATDKIFFGNQFLPSSN